MNPWPHPRGFFEYLRPLVKVVLALFGSVTLVAGILLIVSAFLLVRIEERSVLFFYFGLGVLFVWLGLFSPRTFRQL